MKGGGLNRWQPFSSFAPNHISNQIGSGFLSLDTLKKIAGAAISGAVEGGMRDAMRFKDPTHGAEEGAAKAVIKELSSYAGDSSQKGSGVKRRKPPKRRRALKRTRTIFD